MYFFHNFVFTRKEYGTSFLEMLKLGLTQLGVTFTDTCVCPTPTPPMNGPFGASRGSLAVSDEELHTEVLRSMFEEIQTLKAEVEQLRNQINQINNN